MVAPEDLRRWAAQETDGPAHQAWLQSHFAASPGAIVLLDGAKLRIPTIVTARLPGGRCNFLGADEGCGIHARAPYGCAYFQHDMNDQEGNRRSQIALVDILYDLVTAGPYSRL